MARRTSSEMFPVVQKYVNGEMDRSEICDAYGLKVATLDYWLRKYRSQAQTSNGRFIALQPVPSAENGYEMEVEVIGGTKYRFKHLVPAEYLVQLLSK